MLDFRITFHPLFFCFFSFLYSDKSNIPVKYQLAKKISLRLSEISPAVEVMLDWRFSSLT